MIGVPQYRMFDRKDFLYESRNRKCRVLGSESRKFQKSVQNATLSCTLFLMEGGTDALEFEEEIVLLVAANKNKKVNTVCQTGFDTL